jgi:hypothetical protein
MVLTRYGTDADSAVETVSAKLKKFKHQYDIQVMDDQTVPAVEIFPKNSNVNVSS